MGKYLIQDIVPSSRKRSVATKKDAAHPHSVTLQEKVPHAHKETHVHDEMPLKQHAHSIHMPEETHLDTHDRLLDDEVIKKEAYNPEFLALTDEVIVPTEEVAGSWPYNNDNIPSHSTTPQFGNNRPSHFSQSVGNDGTKGGSWLPWILGPLALIGALFFVFNFFSSATITLIPKESTLPIDQKFTAYKDKADGKLSYAVMKIELSDTHEVPATGIKTVTTKALGKIIIYNEQSTAQRLIKNTRFESTAGKIYRINESITVPKSVTKSGRKTPGSIEMTVYADEAGAEYNSDPTDFTVPGLKNTPQAKLVYARSKGVIAGGASGTTKSVSDQDLKKAGDDLRIALETKLRSKARGDLAPSQIAYDQGIIVDLNDPVLSNEKATSDDKAVVSETGSIYMVVFDRAQLTKVIAKSVVPTYGGEDVALTNLENLTFGLPDIKSDALWKDDKLEFSLKGTPQLKWIINEELVKKDVLGLLKSDFNTRMAAYPTVERAKASSRPFWKKHFPTDPHAITIKIVEQITD